MIPAYFGSAREPLYGVHHRPERPTSGPTGIVLCAPAFHEAVNSHRAFRQLADQFARAGVHALRFDYGGTGDSAGEASRFRVGNCVGDVLAAREELRAARGLAHVGIAGLRLGASFAALAAAECTDLPFLVLWEPIVDGGPYLQELRQMQRAWVDFEAQERPAARRLAVEHEVLGCPLPPELASELEALTLTPGTRLAARTLLIDEGAGARTAELGRALERAGSRVEHRRVDHGRVWIRDFAGEQAPVPRALLDEIVEWVLPRGER